MEYRKRVAILVGQADEETQSRFISGFLESAFEYDFDVCIFSMFRKYQDSVEREEAESNIFNLPNWKEFDGVLILKDSIQTPHVASEIEKRLKNEYEGEVLVIDLESEFFPSVITDGYKPIYDVVSHLIEHHDFHKIAFLAGKKWHKHSIQRVNGYKAAMEEHGLKISDEWIIYGDFWYDSGELCAETLLNSKAGLPEAVACANDCMAIGLCNAFEKRGIHVPEDIAVVGFDSSEEGRRSPKPITSSILPVKDNGRYAATYFNAKFKEEGIPAYQVKAKQFIGQSCGCSLEKKEVQYYKNHLRTEWGTDISEEGFKSVFNSFESNLFEETSLAGYLNTVYSYIYQIKGVEEFSLFLSKPWEKMDKEPRMSVTNEGYSPQMIRAIRYKKDAPDNEVGLTEVMDVKQMLPELYGRSSKPRAYFFTPFFYENRCFGYTVLSYGQVAVSYDEVYRLWMSCIARGLESVRRTIAINVLESQSRPINKFNFSEQINDLKEEEKEDFTLVEKILDENLFHYHFQPIVNTKDGSIYSYEALMRSDTEKMVSPLDIIKYAGMMNRLADVEKATFLNILSIIEEKQAVFEGKKVFINSIPGIKISSEDLDRVSNLLQKEAKNVVVELTEEAELDDIELENTQNFFKNFGIETAVDDYGTGYSNVSNLLRYMPNYVKIDRSLLSEIQNKTQKQHFVREIIEFCHDNGIMALAEGIETKEELQMVILLGADLIQGYYTGRPKAEIIPEIDEKIKREIISFKEEQQDGQRKHLYVAGRTNRVSLNALVRSGNTDILVGVQNAVYKDLSIIGTPGLKTDIHLRIESDYEGRITLENVYFANVKNRPCIEIGPNAKATLILKGENTLYDGGILVPERSRLTIEGDGNVKIVLNASESFGIGNYPDAHHGEIYFQQDGDIRIMAKGREGICIGSGLGGKTYIQKGKYILEGNGDICIGVGSLNGEEDIQIESCLIEMEISATKAVGIGSLNKPAKVGISKTALRCSIFGGEVVGMGSLYGEYASFSGDNGNYAVHLRAEKSAAFGAMQGKTDIFIQNAVLSAECNGKYSLALGGYEQETVVSIENAEIKTDVWNEVGIITSAKFAESKIKNGRIRRRINGVDKEDVTDNPQKLLAQT
ncbi:MAG: EAL domain-containing protein [Lachnospiraceae bacterium]|nr:EAL domain-containing protein [Lachnospiraceae bacterium]